MQGVRAVRKFSIDPWSQRYSAMVGLTLRRPATWVDPKGPEVWIPICQYLVRNSYDTNSCANLAPSSDFLPADRYVSGQVWIDELSLLGNTSEIYVIRE